MKRRCWILGTFVVLASLALFVTSTGAQPGTVKQIVPGVWFREGDLENQGHCNNIIIEMKDYLIVVEAGQVCLRHPSPRRSRLRQSSLDTGRRDHARLQGRRRGDEAL